MTFKVELFAFFDNTLLFAFFDNTYKSLDLVKYNHSILFFNPLAVVTCLFNVLVDGLHQVIKADAFPLSAGHILIGEEDDIEQVSTFIIDNLDPPIELIALDVEGDARISLQYTKLAETPAKYL